VRPGTIRRTSLIERLTRDDSRPIVSVVAPPGYGKTTLLSHWAERSSQAFAFGYDIVAALEELDDH
jgi:LuxR family transcriptional regulator, maltose regulon positive regulatory protein